MTGTRVNAEFAGSLPRLVSTTGQLLVTSAEPSSGKSILEIDLSPKKLYIFLGESQRGRQIVHARRLGRALSTHPWKNIAPAVGLRNVSGTHTLVLRLSNLTFQGGDEVK